jgi:hypothetical protein
VYSFQTVFSTVSQTFFRRFLIWEKAGRLPMDYTWVILLIAISATAILLLLLHGTPLGDLVHDGISDRPRRRLFVASVSFFLTFGGVRGVVFCITHQIPPFHFVIMDGRHVHHLVFGIAILLFVGYGWLCEFGTGADNSSLLAGRLMAILYGVGAALTLDEFALWLNLKDVYWSPQGRESIDAVFLFGALLSAGVWGAPLVGWARKRRAQK